MFPTGLAPEGSLDVGRERERGMRNTLQTDGDGARENGGGWMANKTQEGER